MIKLLKKIYNAVVINGYGRIRALYYGIYFKRLGKRTVIMRDFEMRGPDGISIGDHVNIGPFAFFEGAGGIEIGNNILISPRVSLITSEHRFDRTDIPIIDQGAIYDKIIVEDDVWIGAHVVILKGVTIGKGSIIAAGVVVNK